MELRWGVVHLGEKRFELLTYADNIVLSDGYEDGLRQQVKKLLEAVMYISLELMNERETTIIAVQ